MTQRLLITTRRSVAERDVTEYNRIWEDLRVAAVATGAHAWRFFSLKDGSGQSLEFLEFSGSEDPRSSASVVRHQDALEAVAPGVTEEWFDATLPEHLEMNE